MMGCEDWEEDEPKEMHDESVKDCNWVYVGNGIEVCSTTTKFDKGDRLVLKASGRKFLIIDEKKNENNEFQELCKFDDDERHPIWIEHGHLIGAADKTD